MSQEDFDIDSLAAYLHLTPSQVSRMVDRGKLPARRIGGQLRFSQAEIHHWLEEHIGALDEQELQQMETVLDRSATDIERSLLLHDLLHPQAIAIPLSARTKDSAITSMVELAANAGLLWEPDKMAEAVRQRENLHHTALDNGVALLHPRRPLPTILSEACLALGLTQRGIPFGHSRGTLTDVFFLICSTDDRCHLRVLARLSRLIAAPAFLPELRSAGSADEAHAIVTKFEQELD